MRRDAVDRFWAKVDASGECWMWAASQNPDGYGHFWLNGKVELAHRIAYALTHGAIPDGAMVLHACDNPSCVRPEHLFLGDQLANMQDAKGKGRLRGGRRGRWDGQWTTADGGRSPRGASRDAC